MKPLFAIGRAIFGGYFLYNGLNHFRHLSSMAGYARSKGTPDPETAVLGSGALLIAAGTSIVTGIRPRRGLAALVAFLVPVSLQMHRFWEASDPGTRQSEEVNFTKNMALIGAALMLTALPEPWPGNTHARPRPRSSPETVYRELPARAIRELPA